MPQFALNTSQGLRPLGKLDSIEDVKKLRIFKDNPSWIAKVEIVTVTKPTRIEAHSNRWRIITTVGTYDLLGYYTYAEFQEVLSTWVAVQSWRRVSKREYHESDGKIEC